MAKKVTKETKEVKQKQVIKTKPKEGPKFDPQKNYEWKAEDQFLINGNEFSILYNTMKRIVSEKKLVDASFEIVQNLLESGIESGVITETVEEIPAEDIS